MIECDVLFVPVPTGELELFTVWIDTAPGNHDPDWWWDGTDSAFKFQLGQALDHAAKLRTGGWTCQVLPSHHNPRPDGRWDNPTSDE